jgi:hypothetical protein
MSPQENQRLSAVGSNHKAKNQDERPQTEKPAHLQNRTLDRWGSKNKVAMTSNFNLELLLRMELRSICLDSYGSNEAIDWVKFAKSSRGTIGLHR